MNKRKYCPMSFGSEDRYCGDSCQWRHGGVCDVSRIAAQMMVVPASMQRLAGDTTTSEFEDAVRLTVEIFAGKEADR